MTAARIAPERLKLPDPPASGSSAAEWAGYHRLKQIRDTAEKFETTFASQMLQHMWAGVKTEAPFGGGNAEETWRSMLTEQYAKQLSQRGGLGIADMVYKQMLKMQEDGK